MVSSHVPWMNPFPRCVPMESEEPLNPSPIGLLRPRGVVLGQASFVDLIHQPHGSRMACEDSNAKYMEV